MKKIFISIIVLGLSFITIGCNNTNKKEQNVNKVISESQEITDKSKEDTDKKENESDKEDQARKANETFAKLLKDKDWLCTNTDYGEGNSNVTFSILDINKDGISEMLIYHGDMHGLGGLTVSVVTYNNGMIDIKPLSASHTQYIKYSESEKALYIIGGNMGFSNGYEYILEDAEIKQISSWTDNLGNAGAENKIYKINEESVSEDVYQEIIKKYEDSTDINFYPINNENIEKYLGVKYQEDNTRYTPIGNEKVENTEEYNKVISLAVSSIIDKMKIVDNENYTWNVGFEQGTLYYGDNLTEGLVTVKKDLSPYVLVSSCDLLEYSEGRFDSHSAGGNDIVAWANLRDDGIWEVRGEYLFGFQVKSDNASIISNYDSQTKQVDDSCILVYPDGTVKFAGNINEVSYEE